MPGCQFQVLRRARPPRLSSFLRRESVQDFCSHVIVVPEGYWAIKVLVRSPLIYPYSITGGFKVAGPSPTMLMLEETATGGYVLLYGREPFGVIRTWSEGLVDTGLYFYPARQIHKGELGRVPEIKTPLFAREAPDKVSEWTSSRDRQRGHIGWARLTDVADMLNTTPWDLILDFWSFVDARDRRGLRDEEVTIDLILADVREEIHKQVIRPNQRRQTTRERIEAMVREDDIDWSIFWIRRGFARTVLMLHHFGYAPDAVETSAPA